MGPKSDKSSPATHSFGVDIGRHTIKTVLLEHTSQGLAVRHAARIPILPDAFRNGSINAQTEVAQQIRNIVRQMGVSIRTASVAVPTEHVVLRWIDLPMMDAGSLQSASRFEASRYLPYSTDDAEIVMIPAGHINGNDETPRMRALLAAAPKRVVRSRAEVLELAGLDVARIEIEPFACIRAFGEASSATSSLWRGQPLVHIHLGEESSSMYVVQDGQLRFVHTLSWGCSRLTNALATSLAIPLHEAINLKEGDTAQVDASGMFFWGDPEAELKTDALLPEFSRLCREVHRLLNYYRSLFPERSYEGILDRLALSGGTANLKGLSDLFGSIFKGGVSVLNPFQSFATHLAGASFEAVSGHSSSFVIATGLALTDLRRDTRSKQTASKQPVEVVWRRKAA